MKVSRNDLLKIIKEGNFKTLENCDVFEIDDFAGIFLNSSITSEE